jgi:hypothetical protein
MKRSLPHCGPWSNSLINSNSEGLGKTRGRFGRPRAHATDSASSRAKLCLSSAVGRDIAQASASEFDDPRESQEAKLAMLVAAMTTVSA